MSSNIFQYGYDEYFLNHDVLPYLIDNKKKILAVMFNIPPGGIFRKLFINLQIETNVFEDMTDKQREVLTQLLKDILGNDYDSSKNLLDNYENIKKRIEDPLFVAHMYDSFLKLRLDGSNKVLHISEQEYKCIEEAREMTKHDKYVTIGGRKKKAYWI